MGLLTEERIQELVAAYAENLRQTFLQVDSNAKTNQQKAVDLFEQTLREI